MKIILVNTIAGEGSTGVIVDGIARGLKNRGDEVYVCSSRGASNVVDQKHSLLIGSATSRMTHALMTRLMDRHALHSSIPTFKLIHFIDRIEPDVVHLHNLHGYYLDLPLLMKYLRATRIPTVLTLHDCWTMTGHCTYPTLAGCKKYADATCSECPLKGEYPRSIWLDRSRENVMMKRGLLEDFEQLYITAVSPWMADVVHGSWLCKHPIYTIENGINEDIFHPFEDIKPKRQVLAVANVWTEAKGFNDLLRVKEILPEGYTLTVVGGNRRQRKLLGGSVQTYARVTQRELAKIYAESAVTLNLSRAESFGMTLLESIACSTPVVSYRNSAVERTITPSRGILIEDKDVTAVAPAIERATRLPRMSVAKDVRTAKDMTRDYLCLYDNLI